MRINLTGVSAENPNEWIKPIRKADGTFEVKKYVLKIIAVDDLGYNSRGEQELKVDFKTGDNKSYQEKFPLAENLLWKLKQFTVAMQAPDDFDANNLVSRYVTATLGGREHNGKDYNQLLSWEYAPQNDKLAPIPSAVESGEEEVEELF